MGNAPIQLGVQTDQQTYQHGQTLSGTVYLSVSSMNAEIQSYQGIRLSFTGHENTEVKIREENGSRGTTTYRTERESSAIHHVEVPLTTFSSPLRIAKYEFPFEWKLPEIPLPSSFRHRDGGLHKGHCEVRYTLSAFLVPQERQVGFFHGFNPRNAAGTYASQTIQFVGAPTRAIPEPIRLAEERTVMNGLCCCWRQGHVSLGWQADTIVLTPRAECHLQIMGSNASAIPVPKLRVQLLQSVHWQAGGDDFRKRHTRTCNSTLVDYYIDVAHLPQWNPTQKGQQTGYQSLQTDQEGEYGNNRINVDDEEDDYNFEDDDVHLQQQQQQQQVPITTSFQVPPDVMDSYQGNNCRVEHILIVSAVTRFLATSPKVPYRVHIQRIGMGTGAELPVATAWMEETEFQDVCLPSDWCPDEKVPIIHLAEIVTPADININVATAEAVMIQPTSFATAAASTTTCGTNTTTMTNNSSDDDPMAFARPAGMSDPISDTDLDNDELYRQKAYGSPP